MKKVLSILICTLILMTALCVVASAESSNTYTFETEDTHYTVTFENNNLTAEQQQIVAEGLVFGKDDSAQTYGLGCILFGHDYIYTTAEVIIHKVKAARPRCVKEFYDVTYCEDCDFYEETRTGYTYINCCAVD